MARKTVSVLAALAVLAVVALSPDDALAQRRGGGRPHGPVFVGGYFYDPFFGPYPWWGPGAYPYPSFPVYDDSARARRRVRDEDRAGGRRFLHADERLWWPRAHVWGCSPGLAAVEQRADRSGLTRAGRPRHGNHNRDDHPDRPQRPGDAARLPPHLEQSRRIRTAGRSHGEGRSTSSSRLRRRLQGRERLPARERPLQRRTSDRIGHVRPIRYRAGACAAISVSHRSMLMRALSNGPGRMLSWPANGRSIATMK